MKAKRTFVIGVAVGAVIVALIWASWYKVITGSNTKHEHIYGRWHTAPNIVSSGHAYPFNERFCIICGWRDIRMTMGENSAP